MGKGKIEQFILEKSGLKPPEPPIEKFKRLAGELREKFERDKKIHQEMGKSSHPFLEGQALLTIKIILRFIDTITGEHYEIIRARLKHIGKKAIKQAEQLNQEYADLMEKVVETAENIYFGFDNFEKAMQDLKDFEEKLTVVESESTAENNIELNQTETKIN